MITIPLSKTGKHKGKYTTIIDDCDRDLAELNWHILPGGNTQYAVRHGSGSSKSRLHIIILERIIQRQLSPLEEVDHIDRDGLNNLRSNLRAATRSQNQINTSIQSNNTSGHVGVYFMKDRQSWRIQIGKNGKRIYLEFETIEEAISARQEMVKLHYGKFANLG